MPLALAPLLLLAAARGEGVERPVLPFRSLAGEDGVHVLYSNPALMNFDTDPGFGLFYDASGGNNVLSSLTVATTGGGVGAGLGYRDLGAAGAWWTVSSGASFKLARTLTFGSSVNWQLPEGGDNNFVSWDLGLAWRPTPFLGVAGVIQNVGDPAPDLGVTSRYAAGIALRPAGDLVTLGVDYLARAPVDLPVEHRLQASLRLRPVRGLWIRLFADDSVTDPRDLNVGGAIELHFADLAVGIEGRTNAENPGSPGSPGRPGRPGSPGAGAYLTTVAEDDQLFRGKREVATFVLDRDYPYQPRGDLLSEAPEGYLTLLRRIRDATLDPQVRGLLIEIDAAPFSFAQVEELRDLLKVARSQGKPVIGYLSGEATNASYLLVNSCDRVYLHPAGQLDLIGLGAELQFFKGALELVGVNAQYAKRGIYKSAPEQWTETQASGPAREEMNALLDDLYATLGDGIALGRGKSPDEVRALIDKGPFSSTEALESGLVDGLAYPDELEAALSGAFPDGFSRNESYGRGPNTSGWEAQRAIAVVVVDGVIASGESSSGGILGGAATGSRTIVRALEEARETGAVKGVVLRVDSPGGSAFASDEIWRAVKELREAGKPVIVSMGGYAASGGYYVAAGADAIYALPSTITGSIGVYGGKLNGAGLFDKLNIQTERFDRGRNASMYSVAKPFDDIEYAALDRMISHTYGRFTEKVSVGRNLTPERVEELARGRVWSGRAAKERGLVDEEGNFFDAVDRARAAAGLRPDAPYSLVTYNPWARGVGDVPAQIVRAFSPKIELPPEVQAFWSLAALRDERIFAMMPYHLEIQ